MTITVNWEQATSYAAASDRLALTALLAKSAKLTTRAGVLPYDGTDLSVTAQGSPNMTVAVAAGQCVLPGVGGGYIGSNSASLNVTITAANGSNPRKDIVIFQVLDAEAGDGSSQGQIVALAGTPGSSPSAPAVPARSILLATVTVGTAVTSITSGNIVDGRVFTATAGGTLIVASLAAAPTASGCPYQSIYTIDTHRTYMSDGTAWRKQMAGDVLGKVSNAGSLALSTTAEFFDPAGVQYTFTDPRNIRFHLEATFQQGGAAATSWRTRLLYQAGTGTGSPLAVISTAYQITTVAGTPITLVSDDYLVGTVSTGTYSFYGGYTRNSGGQASDARVSSVLTLYDAGPV